MIVKICGITCLDDALAAVECGADALGFNFYPPSPRCIGVETACEIASKMPQNVLKVGVFVQKNGVFEAPKHAFLDIFQLHGDSTAPGLRIWKAFSMTADFDPRMLQNWDTVLLDTPTPQMGGSGQTFDWRRAAIPGKRVIVAGGLDASNVARAIELARPWGVDVCSRIESSPGRKDRTKMAAFIAAAKACS